MGRADGAGGRGDGPGAVPLPLAHPATPAEPAATPMPPPAGTVAGTDTQPVDAQELRRLRREASQRTELARRLAELIPGMPDALVWQAERALAEAGVRTVVPDGELFDATFHHAVGTEPVPSDGRRNTVARTVRPGYADDEHILVYPRVVVYTDEAQEQGP